MTREQFWTALKAVEELSNDRLGVYLDDSKTFTEEQQNEALDDAYYLTKALKVLWKFKR